MAGIIPAVAHLTGSNLVLVIAVAVVALIALARCSGARSWQLVRAPTT
jgi:hypothetical protein